MWTLVCEMRVSVLFPLLIIVCRDTRFALAATVFITVASTRCLVGLETTAPWSSSSLWISLLWTVRVLPYFVIGILLSKHSAHLSSLLGHLPANARVALLAVPLLALWVGHRGYLSIRRDILFDVGMAMALILAINLPRLSAILNGSILQWLAGFHTASTWCIRRFLSLCFTRYQGVRPFGSLLSLSSPHHRSRQPLCTGWLRSRQSALAVAWQGDPGPRHNRI